MLCGSVRTPIGQFLGILSDISTVELGTISAKETIKRSKVPTDQIDEVILGHVLNAGDGQNPARQVSIKSGIPESVPAIQTSVLCGSGLRSIIDAVRSIKAGDCDVILAGGMESMSRAGHVQKLRKALNKKFGPIKLNKIFESRDDLVLIDTMLNDGLVCSLTNQHMGNTAENIAQKFNISRDEQDQFAKQSQTKALAAIKSGKFESEIVPVDREGCSIERDECPVDIDQSEYSTYPTVFKKDGTVTKFNACGLNDGASTVLLASREKATELGLEIEAEVLGTAMVGCDPNTMGLGPVFAVKKLCKNIKINIEDVDLFELNEAFASQSLACIKQLGVPAEKVNVNGGSIALGHPIGASGARIVTTLINGLKQNDKNIGIASLCIGGGMGIAIAIKLH